MRFNREHCCRVLEWMKVWWGLIVGVWLVAVSVALLVLGVMTFATQRNQEQLAQAAKSQSENIQRERAESIRLSCAEQNGRNTLALKRLRQLTNDPRAIGRTKLLIDALAPVKDCDDLAKRRVRDR